MSTDDALTDDVLGMLLATSRKAESPPWKSWVEGRDHLGGDSFIQVGTDGERGVDIYVSRDDTPAGPHELDVIALSRTYLPVLVEEVRRLSAAQVEEAATVRNSSFDPVLDQPGIEDFVIAAKEVMNWVDDDGRPVLELLPRLTRLLDCGFRLPHLEPTESNPSDLDALVDSAHVQASVARRLSSDMYWTVMDRFEMDEPASKHGVGMISDDLVDIYRDIAHGFVMMEHGEAVDAIWHWRFSFDSHWGRHAVDAVAALHHLHW